MRMTKSQSHRLITSPGKSPGKSLSRWAKTLQAHGFHSFPIFGIFRETSGFFGIFREKFKGERRGRTREQNECEQPLCRDEQSLNTRRLGQQRPGELGDVPALRPAGCNRHSSMLGAGVKSGLTHQVVSSWALLL